MWTQSDLQKAYGLSADQVRARISLLRETLGHDVTRGPRGRILVGDEIRAALARMVELEKRGAGPSQARDVIAQELGAPSTTATETAPRSPTVAPEVAVLQDVIADLRQERDHWRELAMRLQEERTLALPAPRPWWRRLLG